MRMGSRGPLRRLAIRYPTGSRRRTVRLENAFGMNIDSTNVAAINPERRTILFANRASARGELAEGEFMAAVDEVAELLRELGAKWMDIEVAVIAAVEHAVDGFTADIAAAMVHLVDQSKAVGVEKGG